MIKKRVNSFLMAKLDKKKFDSIKKVKRILNALKKVYNSKIIQNYFMGVKFYCEESSHIVVYNNFIQGHGNIMIFFCRKGIYINYHGYEKRVKLGAHQVKDILDDIEYKKSENEPLTVDIRCLFSTRAIWKSIYRCHIKHEE